MADKQFLDDLYGKAGAHNMKEIYRDWAASYDEEVASNGYATPSRAAKALAQFADRDAAIFDIGCGTGLYGLALREEGFSTVDGCDLSPEMLEKAKATGAYRKLWVSELGEPLDFSSGPYPAVSAIGVIGSGAAPVEFFDEITSHLSPGVLFVFSLNDHTLQNPAFEAAVNASVDSGAFELLHREYGTHLPKRDIKSLVYVLKKR